MVEVIEKNEVFADDEKYGVSKFPNTHKNGKEVIKMIGISTGAYLIDREPAYIDPELLTIEGVAADKHRLTWKIEIEENAQ